MKVSKKKLVTNAMRQLTAQKIPFEVIEYAVTEVGSHFGETIAELTGISKKQSFKTLVARGEKNGIAVVCIPADQEVDLKKLAKVAGEKKMELVPVRELFALTGYVRGGVSPLGMKKKYPTYFERSGQKYEFVAVSAGVCGAALWIAPQDVCRAAGAEFVDLVKEE